MQQKLNLVCCLLACYVSANAQHFAVKANLEHVNAAGFYSINISPQLSSYTSINFSDLRVADENNRFVPYIIRSKKPSFVTQNYNKMPVIENELTDSGKSELTIKNIEGAKISSIALLIRNAAVNRFASISGSDDAKKWFTINENINLEDISGDDTDRYIQTINFPVSSYHFFKIIIDNKKNNPLNIIEAGSYNNIEHVTDAYSTIPAAAFEQVDSSDNNSYIKVHQNAAYHINRIRLEVESPKFFERNIEILNSDNLPSFNISSTGINELTLPDFDDKNWTIRIYNGDNPPLKLKAIVLKQELKSIITYLQAGKTYHLLLRDSSALTPVYDLQKFEDSIPDVIPELKIISFENINPAEARKSKTGLAAGWIWILIAIVLAALGFITFRLMKEVNKEK